MSEVNMLEYLFQSHSSQLRREADLVVLYIHACLLDRKAKLAGGSAVLPPTWNASDPVQLTYHMSPESSDYPIQVSVVATAGDIFVAVTDDRRDRVGSVELAAGQLCRLADSLAGAFPNLDELRRQFEAGVWSVVFPAKPPSPAPKSQRQEGREDPRGPYYPPGMAGRLPQSVGGGGLFRPPEFDYGRSDLDPFGLGRNPLGGGGPGGFGGGGGMLFNPMRHPPHGTGTAGPDRFGGLPEPLPPGSVPPGARFDPIGPPRGQQSRRHWGPDPDGPAGGSGWEDMYL